MKKLCVWLLLAALLASAAFADAALDAAMEAGALNLVPVEWPGFTLGAEDQLVSLSPDGQSAIAVVDGALSTVSGGAAHPLWHNPERGVADAYGKLERILRVAASNPLNITGSEGYVWSPNANYVIPGNCELFSGTMFIFDPMLIDVHTGEIVLLGAYSDKPLQEDALTTTTAAFSADGANAYYLCYGPTYGGRGALLQADLSTFELKPVYVFPDDISPDIYPCLSPFPDGRLAGLSDMDRRNGLKPQGLVVYALNGDEATRAVESFDLPNADFSCKELRVSSLSGRGVVYGSAGIMQAPVFGEVLENLGRYYIIDLEAGSVIEVDPETATQIERASQEPGADWPEDLPQSATILNAALSPDGEYAFITCVLERGVGSALLLRLSDMASVPVESNAITFPARINYLNWSEAGILAPNAEGRMQLYAIQ